MERVADYIIRKLSEKEIETIFMISGRGVLYLTDAVAKNPNIKHVCCYNEQAVSYAAMSNAAAKNGISACLVSTGCASTNAVTACLCAYQDNLPVVFLSGNNPLNETTRYTKAPIRTYGSQEADIIEIVDSITKYSVMITDKESIVYEIEKALYLALDGRKGPVWIDVPLDIQNMRINENDQKHFIPPEDIKRNIHKDIEEVANAISTANRPILLIGGGTRNARDEIYEFVDKCNIPVVFSPSACDVYGTFNELSIGAIGSIGGSRAGNFAIQNSDYVIAVGTKLSLQETGRRDVFARCAKIVVIDIDEDEHKKNGVKIDKLIIDDAKHFFELLNGIIIDRIDKAWIEKCVWWKKKFSLENERFIEELKKNNKIDIHLFADALSRYSNEDTTIITDAGFEELIIPSTVMFRKNQRCLFPASQGAMGYAIPAIIGAYFAGCNNIICVVGDGSFMMNMQELGVIRYNKIPVTIIVINNNMYSVIRKRQSDLFRQRTIGNDPSDGVPSPNIKKIAYSVDAEYIKINELSELDEFFKRDFVSNKMRIVEVISEIAQVYFHESYALNDKRRLVHRPIEDMSPFLDRDVIKEEMLVDMID